MPAFLAFVTVPTALAPALATITSPTSDTGETTEALLIQFRSMFRSTLVCAFVFAAAGVQAAPLDQKEVEFAQPGGKKLYLDLHVPDGAGPFPAAILVHGGGFDEGTRATNVRPLFEPLANAGFAWFSIDYRLAPAFKFPQANEDLNSRDHVGERRTRRSTRSTSRGWRSLASLPAGSL